MLNKSFHFYAIAFRVCRQSQVHLDSTNQKAEQRTFALSKTEKTNVTSQLINGFELSVEAT
ncbi:MAG: hypothetical protein CSA26_09310 [Desulfobacterales bacterium]|nr:MAG: hypothetical protein CSA26_09310 [Desulfobacterales bacterium]